MSEKIAGFLIFLEGAFAVCCVVMIIAGLPFEGWLAAYLLCEFIFSSVNFLIPQTHDGDEQKKENEPVKKTTMEVLTRFSNVNGPTNPCIKCGNFPSVGYDEDKSQFCLYCQTCDIKTDHYPHREDARQEWNYFNKQKE